KAELDDAPSRRRGFRRRHDRAGGAIAACRTRDRRADEADADQRDALEDGRGPAHAFLPGVLSESLSESLPESLPMNSASVATTRRLASSVPTERRSAFGSL